MKRIVFLLSVLVPALFMCDAELRYGFRFGGEIADGKLSEAAGYSLINKSGFSGGFALEYQNSKSGFAADIAALYTRYSSSLSSTDGDMGYFCRDYIDVPIHLKYKFWLKESKNLIAPLIYTGPSAMFRLSHANSHPMATGRVLPRWDVGIGIDAINFLQVTAGYRFALNNGIKSFAGCDGAVFHSNAWTVSATILFDF